MTFVINPLIFVRTKKQMIMKTEKLNVAVGQIIKMQDSDGTFDVIVTSTNAENYFLIQPIGAALMFKKVSYQGKAFKSKATVCK